MEGGAEAGPCGFAADSEHLFLLSELGRPWGLRRGAYKSDPCKEIFPIFWEEVSAPGFFLGTWHCEFWLPAAGVAMRGIIEGGSRLKTTSGATCDALGKGGRAAGGAGPCSCPLLSVYLGR